MRGENVAGVRGNHPAGLALQQRLSDFFFESLELLGNAGRRLHVFFGSSRNGAEFHDIQQQFQSYDVQHEILL